MVTERPPWWIDELAHAGAEHLDEEYVEGYERKSGYDGHADADVLVSLGLDETSTVVDLAAGPGQFSRAVAPRCGRVVAVEVSPAMVTVLRRRIAAQGLTNVEVVSGGYLSYEHTGGAADFVFSRNALHQVPDFWKGVALARIHAMLRPGGVLRLHDLVFDFDPADAPDRIAAWIAGAVDDPARGWTAAELEEHVRLEYSTYSWLFEPMLERVGFEILDAAYVRGAYGAYTCRRI
ncbi:class I SAM-dependent methyltransferase [Desertimonas flava]|uniref:class I SAM-dependent methyltransferase n=1 Tax=Desertimonas flava TaxID=2064846 RepID=UPI000E343BA1|nr:class I SAM-dependent methyltransferase [Desertimonas flava]